METDRGRKSGASSIGVSLIWELNNDNNNNNNNNNRLIIIMDSSNSFSFRSPFYKPTK
jgi:hypothetical protein